MLRSFLVGALMCATSVLAGCHTAPAARPTDANSPADKAHAEQLSQMSREDAQQLRVKPRDLQNDTAGTRRGAGQGVVDQPVRR